eukprot:5432637-Pyramimonas_sp.AAC.1
MADVSEESLAQLTYRNEVLLSFLIVTFYVVGCRSSVVVVVRRRRRRPSSAVVFPSSPPRPSCSTNVLKVHVAVRPRFETRGSRFELRGSR